MKYIRYFVGSLIISFGVLLVIVILSRALQIEPPKDILIYLAVAWLSLAIALMPIAKKVMRD